ncbi:hypothetical protein ACP70R_036035 [Stipagrostis hirtigluma subsp. patula]
MAQTEGSVTHSSSETIPSESHADLVSKLPTREGWSEPLVLYNNYWIRPHFVERIMHLHNSFKARLEDTILATNPKCGTTWLKALVFAITNRSRYDFDDHHPLLCRHPQEVVPFIEIPLSGRDLNYVETLPSPRILATHMPVSLLPESVIGSGSRLVYICRDPKDVFVSRWHFENRIRVGPLIDLEETFNMFCEGVSPFGPFWDHCLGYWRESITRPDKVLFLRYEEMMSDPVKYVKRLATFLGAPFTIKEEEDGIPEEVVRLCSFEKLSDMHVNQTGNISRRENLVIGKSAFFRRGKVGDWVNYMSQEMGRKLDCIVEEKLKGSGLAL